MKKIFSLIFVAVLFSVFALQVEASVSTTATADETMHLKADAANDSVYGVSGIKVYWGTSTADPANDYKYAYKVAKGNDLRVDELDSDDDQVVDKDLPIKWSSFGQIYFNNSDKDITIPRVLVAGFMILTVDGDGHAIRFEDAYKTHDMGQCYLEDGTVADHNGDPVAAGCRKLEGNAQAIDESGKLLYVKEDGTETTDAKETDGTANTPKPKKNEDEEIIKGLAWANADGKKVFIDTADYDTFLAANPGFDVVVYDLIVSQAMATHDGTTASFEYLEWITPPTEDIVVPAGGFILEFEYLDRSNHGELVKGLFDVVMDYGTVTYSYEHKVGPSINGADDVNVPLNATIDVMEGVTAVATQYDYNAAAMTTVETFTCTIDGVACADATIDTNILDTEYEVVYTATDNLGLVTTVTRKVHIVDYLTPIFTGVEDIIADEGADLSETLLEGITVDDGYGNDITADIKVIHGISDVRNAAPGYYVVTYLVYNSKGKAAIETATVTVNDITGPTVVTEDREIEMGIDLDLKSTILLIVDNVDTEFDIQVADDGGFNNTKAGLYTISVDVYDQSGNKTTSTYKVRVLAPPAPPVEEEEVKDNSALVYTSLIVSIIAIGAGGVAIVSKFK